MKMLRRFLIVMLVSIVCGFGCVRLPLKTPARVPKVMPEALRAQVSYPKSRAVVLSVKTLESREKFEVKLVKIQSFVPYAGTNKAIELECYIPHGASNMPVIMLLPVSAGNSYPLERGILAPYFARHGYVAVLVRRENLKGLDSENPKLIDNRRVMDWIETSAFCDASRIGVVGTSIGAIKGSLLVAVDERVKAAVLVLGGADVPYILTYSKEGAWQKRKKGRVEHDRGISGRREAYIKKYNINHAEFEKRLREENIEWDPKNLAPYTDPQKVLLVLGSCDRVVPFKAGMMLRRLMGKPETEIVMSGHYTALLYILHIRSISLSFFQERFAVPTDITP
jgi:hypothetical protein